HSVDQLELRAELGKRLAHRATTFGCQREADHPDGNTPRCHRSHPRLCRVREDAVEHPDVTVVVPAYNAEATLGAQLHALAEQDYRGRIEIVVVDNGSEDSTAAIAEESSQRTSALRVVTASAKQCASHARNAGFREARHELVLGCDADDVVDRAWVSR